MPKWIKLPDFRNLFGGIWTKTEKSGIPEDDIDWCMEAGYIPVVEVIEGTDSEEFKPTKP